ncbi:MAG: sensor histidine kinase [Gemmatimonadota bacterium]
MNQHISELLGVLAHEMRTPIAAILGYQELLSEGIYGKVDERGKEPLERIAYSARQLLHLIDGVQEISSPAAKRLSTHVEPFEPAPVLHSCIANAHADAVGRNVKLEVNVPEQLPQIVGDPDRFCRAIDLVLAAAIKTSHSATLHVRADGGDGIQISIDNTGLDVDRDTPEIGTDSKTQMTGAGLRLAIVREIAHQMHGDLQLQPAQSGTTLVLKFKEA